MITTVTVCGSYDSISYTSKALNKFKTTGSTVSADSHIRLKPRDMFRMKRLRVSEYITPQQQQQQSVPPYRILHKSFV